MPLSGRAGARALSTVSNYIAGPVRSNGGLCRAARRNRCPAFGAADGRRAKIVVAVRAPIADPVLCILERAAATTVRLVVGDVELETSRANADGLSRRWPLLQEHEQSPAIEHYEAYQCIKQEKPQPSRDADRWRPPPGP